jgi:glycogen synthase
MRVLFVSNLYPPLGIGGYEQMCWDMAQGLRDKGHEIRILTSSFRKSELAAEEPDVARVLRFRASWQAPTSGRERELLGNRFQVDRHNFRAFNQAVDTFGPDLVLIFNGGHLGPALLWGAEARGGVAYYLSDGWLSPLLTQQASVRRNPPQRRIYRHLLGKLTAAPRPISASHLIFCSRALQSYYTRNGGNVDGSTVIYLGVSVHEFPFRQQRILTRGHGDPPRILYVGRISADKGVTTLIRALDKLRARPELQEVQLSLLGAFHEPAYEQRVYRLISELHLTGVVHFLGHHPRSEVSSAFAAHDVLAFPSEWEEPFSLTLLQAMASGIPVVSTMRGGSADIVQNGRNALSFSAGDSDDLVSKLAWMLTHAGEAAAMGRAAGKEVRARFGLDSQVEAVERYLQHRLIKVDSVI